MFILDEDLETRREVGFSQWWGWSLRPQSDVVGAEDSVGEAKAEQSQSHNLGKACREDTPHTKGRGSFFPLKGRNKFELLDWSCLSDIQDTILVCKEGRGHYIIHVQ